jgi:hypothetical protein
MFSPIYVYTNSTDLFRLDATEKNTSPSSFLKNQNIEVFDVDYRNQHIFVAQEKGNIMRADLSFSGSLRVIVTNPFKPSLITGT